MIRRDYYHNRSCTPSYIGQGKLARLVRFPIRYFRRRSTPDHRYRIRFVFIDLPSDDQILTMVGAHFLHTLIIRYKNPTNTSVPAATIYETPDASKESLNLLTLVAELYNAGVVGPKLIYDLIRGFIDAGLGEQEVEALLKVVKRES